LVTFSVYFNRKAWKQWLAEIKGKKRNFS